jgi:hypothetical protein
MCINIAVIHFCTFQNHTLKSDFLKKHIMNFPNSRKLCLYSRNKTGICTSALVVCRYAIDSFWKVNTSVATDSVFRWCLLWHFKFTYSRPVKYKTFLHRGSTNTENFVLIGVYHYVYVMVLMSSATCNCRYCTSEQNRHGVLRCSRCVLRKLWSLKLKLWRKSGLFCN